MIRYSIDAALFVLPIPWIKKITHNFWILRECQSQKVVAALHGLPMSRITEKILPMGFTKNHSLRAYHFNYDPQLGDTQSFFLPAQRTQSVVVGDHVLELWQNAVAVLPLINKLDLTYPSCGFKVPLNTTVNSNSVYRTFAEVMNIYPFDFKGCLQIGLEKTLSDIIKI